MLRRSPVPTTVAVLALALGIGVNLTSFIAVNSVVLHPFPFPRLERIMTLWEAPVKSQRELHPFAPANFLDWKEQSRSYSDVAAYRMWDVNLTGSKEPVRVEATLVSPGFFEMLGGSPSSGRTFSKEEGAGGTARTVVVSNGFWRRELASAPDAVGKTVSLGGQSYTVIGVMPADFDFPLSTQLWAPLSLTPSEGAQRSERSLNVLAVLKQRVSVDQSRKEANEIAHSLQIRYPASDEAVSIQVVPIREQANEITGRFLFLLLGCAAFVLLLAAANVGNLQVARATGRLKELAVRAALGASRFQVMRQLFAEGLLISIGGGICGLILASWNISISKARIPVDVFSFVPGLRAMHVDGTVVEYTLLISLFTGILSSLPAMFHIMRQTADTDLNEALQKGGRTSGASSGLNRVQSFLIGYEVAMALVLLVGAGFMVKAFNDILAASYGYDPNHLLRVQVSLPAVPYNSNAQMIGFYDRVLDQFKMLPAARSSAVWADGPDMALFVEGRPAPLPGDLTPQREAVSSGYLRAMGMPLLEGRFFSEGDRPDSPRVAVVSKSVANHFWPSSDPVGQRIKLGSADSAWVTVVGVSGDMVRNWLTSEPAHLVYVPYTQYAPRSTTFVIRTAGDPDGLARAAQSSIRKVDGGLPILAVKSMNRAMYEETSGVRAAADSMKQYAAVALLLAATGIFGVIAHFVAQRTRDIGVRIALGANTGDVLRMTLRRTLYPTVAGIAIGSVAAYGLSAFMASLLFHIVKLDAVTFLGCAALLGGTALLASYLPARKAAQVDPLIALREN